MVSFTDKNGNKITTITNENLQDFFEFTKDKAEYQDDLYISDDIKLTDFFKDYESKSKEEKWNLRYAVVTTFNKIDIEQGKALAREKELKKRTNEQKKYVQSLSERENDSEMKRKELADAEDWLARDEAELMQIGEKLGVYQKRAEEAADLARTNPQIFKDIYEFSGNNSRSGGFYEVINKVAKENTFSNNLYMIDALIESDCFNDDILRGKTEDIRTLPNEKAKIVARLFHDANAYLETEKHTQYKNAKELLLNGWSRGTLSRGDFLNYEPKNIHAYDMATPEQIRTQINKYVNEENVKDLEFKFIFDGKNVKKDLLKKLFETQLNKNDLVQKSGVQEVHDSAAMQRYQQIRQLVLDAADKAVDSYIPNTRGEQKTLTQKYKELIGELYGKPYEECSLGQVGQDYLLSAAYEDINRDNAAKLEKDSIMLVVTHDERGYWLEKIAEKSPETAQKIIKEYSGSFTVRQSRVADVIAPEITLNHDTDFKRLHNATTDVWKMHERDTGDIFKGKSDRFYQEYADGVANSKHMSIAEKEEYLDKAARFVDEQLVKPAEKAHQLTEEYRADLEHCNDLSFQANAKQWTKDFLCELQAQYKNITECFDEGQPKENEQHLLKENVEEVAAAFAHGSCLGVPTERPLPLIFGRRKEQDRREKMAKCIDVFNETLRKHSDTIWKSDDRWTKHVDLEAIKGKMLQESTVEQLQQEAAQIREQYDQMQSALHEKYANEGQFGKKLNLDDAKEADDMWKDAQAKAAKIAKEAEKVRTKKKDLEDQHKENRRALKEDKSPLKAVTPDMSKDEKAEVRKFNKTIKDYMERS